MRKTLIAPWLLIILSACASIGLAPPTTFEDRLAYAVSQNAAVRQAAANSYDAREISQDDARRVLAITDQVRSALDAARIASEAGDPKTAEGRLQLATTILVEIQNYLRKPHADRRSD